MDLTEVTSDPLGMHDLHRDAAVAGGGLPTTSGSNLVLDVDLTQLSGSVVEPSIPQGQVFPREVVFLETPTDPQCDVMILRIDNTTLEGFNVCSRLSWYSTIVKREPDKANNALVFGEAIHAAFELILKKNYEVTSEQIYGTILELFAKRRTVSGDYRTPELAFDVIGKYLKKFAHEPIKLLDCDEKWGERYFEHILGELEVDAFIPYFQRQIRIVKVIWTGRIDGVVPYGDYPLPWVMDHKTTSIGGDTYYDDFYLSQQTVGYSYVCKHELGQPVMGLLLNAIICRPPKKDGTYTLDLERRRYVYTDAVLDEWKVNTLQLCADYIAHLQRNYFPMQTKQCMGKYGRCGYHEVCRQEPEARLTMLASDMFRDVTWTPKKED